MTGARSTTPTDRTSRCATSRRWSSLAGGGWKTKVESHNRWTDERGPVKGDLAEVSRESDHNAFFRGDPPSNLIPSCNFQPRSHGSTRKAKPRLSSEATDAGTLVQPADSANLNGAK